MMILLSTTGLDLSVFGSVWPWRFYKDINTGIISNQYFLTHNALNCFSGYELVENTVMEETLTFLIQEVRKHAIIINVDQFYVKHHYPDIYNKVHGPHSLLLLDYDASREAFLSIGYFPKYKGYISEKEIICGVESFPKDNFGAMKYCYFRKLINWEPPSIENTTLSFVQNLSAKITERNMEVIELNGIYKMIFNIYKKYVESSFNIIHDLNRVIGQRWIWEISRSGNVFKAYLGSEKYSPIPVSAHRENAISMVDDINRELTIAFSKMYKYTLTKQKDHFDNGMDILKDAISKSQSLKNYLIEVINYDKSF